VASPVGLTISNVASDTRYGGESWSRYLMSDSNDSGGGGIIWNKQSTSNNRAIVSNHGDLLFMRSDQDDNSGTPYHDMCILRTGNVGIGTTALGAKLHAHSATAISRTYSPTAEPTDDVKFMTATGSDGTGVGLYQSLELSVGTGASSVGWLNYVRGGDNQGRFTFVQRKASSTYAEQMVISSSGYVGIGTTAPDGKLHVMGASAGSITADANADEAVFEGGGDTGISILSPDDNWGALFFGSPSNDVNAAITGDYNSNSEIMRFWVGDQSAAKMTLNNSGNLGIGTTAPAAKLDVSGSIFPSGNGFHDLGSDTKRWNTVYTSDLSLKNDFGDWTIVEGEDNLFFYFNKKGKTYKFNLTEVDASEVPPKGDE
jgi:hypothetical protein